jgi:4-hydroxybenzoate polyprenyltransferase
MSCGSSVPLTAERGRVVEQKELTKGKAALLLVISALIAIVSAMKLQGWLMYVGLGVAAVVIFFAFIRWNRRD